MLRVPTAQHTKSKIFLKEGKESEGKERKPAIIVTHSVTEEGKDKKKKKINCCFVTETIWILHFASYREN